MYICRLAVSFAQSCFYRASNETILVFIRVYEVDTVAIDYFLTEIYPRIFQITVCDI